MRYPVKLDELGSIPRRHAMILNKDDLYDFFSKYVKEADQRLTKARDAAYAEHASHGCIEQSVEYFDAMMLSVTVKCSCGDLLVIDRDFF